MRSTSCKVLVRQRRACAMIASASVSLVRRKVATGGGTRAASAAISSSSIGPGPLGIVPTRPGAWAPCAIASRASPSDWMQQILIRVRCMFAPSSRAPPLWSRRQRSLFDGEACLAERLGQRLMADRGHLERVDLDRVLLGLDNDPD